MFKFIGSIVVLAIVLIGGVCISGPPGRTKLGEIYSNATRTEWTTDEKVQHPQTYLHSVDVNLKAADQAAISQTLAATTRLSGLKRSEASLAAGLENRARFVAELTTGKTMATSWPIRVRSRDLAEHEANQLLTDASASIVDERNEMELVRRQIEQANHTISECAELRKKIDRDRHQVARVLEELRLRGVQEEVASFDLDSVRNRVVALHDQADSAAAVFGRSVGAPSGPSPTLSQMLGE